MTRINKQKNLIKNTGILGIGILLSKFFSFLLLPIYTRYISTDDYGLVDLMQTVATFILPFVSLELSVSNFRFLIDAKNDNDRKQIISTAFFPQLLLSILFIIITLIVNQFYRVPFLLIFIIYFISLMIYTNIQFVIRGLCKNKVYSIGGFINTIIMLLLNILFIVVLNKSVEYILVAVLISNFITIIYFMIFGNLFDKFSIRCVSKDLFKMLLKYSFPIIFSEVSWWITNTSDRVLIAMFLTLNANGIYAIANKIPAIFVVVFNVFNLAWTEEVSKGLNDSDHKEFINDMYNKSIMLFGCLCLGIICCTSIFFDKLIGVDYHSSYIHIMILIVAVYVNSLCSMLGSIFTGFKSTKDIGITTVAGAIANILINLILIKIIGLYAASISTLISYLIIYITRSIRVRKFINISYNMKNLVLLLIAFVITITCYIINNQILNIVVLIYLLIFTFINNKQLLFEILKKDNN